MPDRGDRFEAATLTIGGVALLSFFQAFFGTGVLVVIPMLAGVELPRPETPRTLSTERLDAEVDVAESLGFVRSDDVALREEDQLHTIELEPGECVAAVASAWGAHRIDWIAAAEGARAPDQDSACARTAYVPGVVGHLQACPLEAGPFTVRVVSTSGLLASADPPFGTLVILRGPAERVSHRLNRGEHRR